MSILHLEKFIDLLLLIDLIRKFKYRHNLTIAQYELKYVLYENNRIETFFLVVFFYYYNFNLDSISDRRLLIYYER